MSAFRSGPDRETRAEAADAAGDLAAVAGSSKSPVPGRGLWCRRAALCAAGLALALLGGCGEAAKWHAVDVSGSLPPLSFSLTRSEDGKRVTEADYRGKVVLLYFGYTQCCPDGPDDARQRGRGPDPPRRRRRTRSACSSSRSTRTATRPRYCPPMSRISRPRSRGCAARPTNSRHWPGAAGSCTRSPRRPGTTPMR